MDITLQIDEQFLKEIDPQPIEKALQRGLQHFSQDTSKAVTIVVTDNLTVQQLNYQHRGFDAPTDVLSFENRPEADFPDLAQSHLGDVIIAYPVAKAQALDAGHTPFDELTLLAVHGLLHLLGFDHDTQANKKKMWAAQHQIMIKLGLAHVQPTEN